jgi:Secretion system C-terminal sorting domain
MKKKLAIVFCLVFINVASSFAQANSFYSVESEYTTTYGYRYFFDKTNTTTGISTQISQLPIAGFYYGINFFNCYGNYVFCGVDSSTTTSPYRYNLYEVDTLGNVVRILPLTSAYGASPDIIYLDRSQNSSLYYGLKWTGTDVREFISMDPLTGAVTVLASTTLLAHSPTIGSAITKDDNLLFFDTNNFTSVVGLYKADGVAHTIVQTDSLTPTERIAYLSYDCVQDSVVGFLTGSLGNVSGSEWIKINDVTGKISRSGTFLFSSSGFFINTGHVFLNGGMFYGKIGVSSAMTFNPTALTGTSFPVTPVYLNPLDLKLTATRETHCNYYSCVAQASVNENSFNNNIHVYPNPFSDNTTFSIQSDKLNEMYSFELTDVLGKKVKSITGIMEKEFQISRTDLKNGIYFYKLTTAKSTVGIGKFVIK